jgi:hypothetical protein
MIAAAELVTFTGKARPHLVVAALMASLFLWSVVQIIRQAIHEMRQDGAVLPPTRDVSV